MTHEAAAWLQAVISGIAIIASGAIAVFVPWNERRQQRRRENRARLDIDSRSSVDGGLELLIVYKPEFHHHALSVAVTLLDPKDARLYRGSIDWSKAPDGRPEAVKKSLSTNLRYHGVPLQQWDKRDLGSPFVGVMYVEYPDERRGPGRAKIMVSVLSHGNFLIARETLNVSATDVEFFPDGAPPVMIDLRGNPHKPI